MKIVQINITSNIGSTGRICNSISKQLNEKNIENYIFYTGNQADDSKNAICYMSKFEVKINALRSRIFGNYGFQTPIATQRIIHALDAIQPDIVHLHNLHGHNCNLAQLFRYFADKRQKVIWTFHDCWAFTGYCTHYDMIQCEKWKMACDECPQYKHYSWFFDRSSYLFKKKKKLLQNVDLTIVTPSEWLANQVRQSFLHKNDVRVIHNGIDISVFQPRHSNFRTRFQCDNKFIILGVSFDWGERKGLDVFLNLEKRLGSEFKIILVGTNDRIDQMLPPEIISIHRTLNQTELAEIYTAADLFVNPTREENYPTVNMEALACGTPVLTYKTGGSTEIIDESCGTYVEKNDEEALYRAIMRIKEEMPFSEEKCRKRANGFDADKCFQSYVELYSELLESV